MIVIFEFKRWFLAIFLFTVICSTSCSQSSIAHIYYISSKGSDTNDGITANTPWKTLKTLKPGCTYLLKRGDTLYFSIGKTDEVGERIIVADYGKGAKPVISLAKNIRQQAWKKTDMNIWKVDMTDSKSFWGYMDVDSVNNDVGFVKFDDEIKGNKLKDVASLKSDGDFYSDSRFLYVYSNQDPSTGSVKVKAVTNHNIITLSNNMEVRNVKLMETGAHAVRGVRCSDITLKNLDISDIGGSYLSARGKKKDLRRYGNGIELWSATNCLIEGCDVKNVYDAAFTLQSAERGAAFDNITFNNNKAADNEQSFEFWVKDKNAFFTKCKFTNNYCSNAGMGWSHAVRPDKNVGVHVLCYFWVNGMQGLAITGNTFVNPRSAYISLPLDIPSALIFTSTNNKIIQGATVPIVNNKGAPYKLNEAKSFSRNFGIEGTSTFTTFKQ